MSVVGSQFPSAQWPGGMTPLQAAFAEAERCQQESDRASKQLLSTKKVRGPCRRISCKARGMSAKHNADTGFFDIPLDAPHGMLLGCSHPECVASGRRFRYCVICEMPFAMRNFLKRHGHGMVQSGKELKEQDVKDLGCVVIENPSSSPASISSSNQTQVIESSSSSSPAMIIPPADQSQVVRRHKRVVSSDKSSNTKSALAINNGEQRWLQLLRQRPDTEDQTKMTMWMDMVISSSEQTKRGKRATEEVKSSSPVTVMTPSIPASPQTASTADMEPLALSAETVDDFDFSTVFDEPYGAAEQEADVNKNQEKSLFSPTTTT